MLAQGSGLQDEYRPVPEQVGDHGGGGNELGFADAHLVSEQQPGLAVDLALPPPACHQGAGPRLPAGLAGHADAADGCNFFAVTSKMTVTVSGCMSAPCCAPR